MTQPAGPAPVRGSAARADRFQSIVHCAQWQAATHRDQRFFAFVDSGRQGLQERERLTYRDMDERARAIAGWLVRRGATDQPVLLLYPAGMDFFVAFLGCLYARALAVPSPLPQTEPRALDRAVAIIKDADVRLILTDAGNAGMLRDWLAAEGLSDRVGCAVVAGGTLPDVPAPAVPAAGPDLPAIDASTPAYLQYTSGSTTEPRGVVLTHGNLLHNSAAIRVVIGSPAAPTGAGWLPHYHDMGLIGLMLQPLYSGGNLVFCSPVSFVMRPVIWLQMISTYAAEFTVAPNFAYDWLHRNVTDAQLDGLDLSSLRWALNGAEPVRSATMTKVTERFAPIGFRPDVWSPGYGLAECTLLVTGTIVGTGATVRRFDRDALEDHRAVPTPDGVELVASGRPVSLDVRVVDPDTGGELPEGRVGEIWVRGGSVAPGYWQRSDAGRFGARLADGSGGFCCTDDLGFFLDGELYVTGRLGELIISNGRNIYPQDVEELIREAEPAASAAAAFAVDTGREELVLVQEVRTQRLDGMTPADFAGRVRGAITRTFAMPAVNVVLVGRGEVGRTTSGKIQRRRTRERFLAGELDVLHAELTPAVRELLAGAAPATGQEAGR